MRILYPVKKNKSFRKNVIEILPLMFDNMMKYKESVIGHPKMKDKLHGMRITGKPMRYLMEIMESSSGKAFSDCLQEIKKIIELMGEIHDCDVFLLELREYLLEIRAYNRGKQNEKKFVTSGILKLILQIREKRNKNYELLCEKLMKWEKEDFKKKLTGAIEIDITNQLNFFETPGKFVNELSKGQNSR